MSENMKKYNVAVVGATGLVGRTFLKVLEEYNFPINELVLYASSRSAGSKVNFMGKEYTIVELTKDANNNLVWMVKDQNGQYYKLGAVSSGNGDSTIAQITNIDQDGTITTNALSYQNGNPVLTNNSQTVTAYTFTGVPIAIQIILPNNETYIFQLENIQAKQHNRIWKNGTKKLYYNNAYNRWQIEDLNYNSLIDYTIETETQPFDSAWNNGSELTKS